MKPSLLTLVLSHGHENAQQPRVREGPRSGSQVISPTSHTPSPRREFFLLEQQAYQRRVSLATSRQVEQEQAQGLVTLDESQVAGTMQVRFHSDIKRHSPPPSPGLTRQKQRNLDNVRRSTRMNQAHGSPRRRSSIDSNSSRLHGILKRPTDPHVELGFGLVESIKSRGLPRRL